jgi:Domain of unknown function (DUF4386)
MSPLRKTALVAGALYLLTFVSIPTLFLYGPVRSPKYIIGPGPDTGALLGGILEMIVALAGIGTAVALYPVVKRQNEGVALGFVGSRVLEAATIFAGVAILLSVVTLRQAGAGADALVTGQALVALYDRTMLLGQGVLPAVNALLLGSCCTSRAWCRGFFPCSDSSERSCSSLPTSARCSTSGGRSPRWRRSPQSRSRYGSFRSAFTSSSKASSPLRSPWVRKWVRSKGRAGTRCGGRSPAQKEG